MTAGMVQTRALGLQADRSNERVERAQGLRLREQGTAEQQMVFLLKSNRTWDRRQRPLSFTSGSSVPYQEPGLE